MNRLGIIIGLVLLVGLLLGCAGNPPVNGDTSPPAADSYASNTDIEQELAAADLDSPDVLLEDDMDPSTVETTDSGLSESDLGE